jgi:hypothetical protein
MPSKVAQLSAQAAQISAQAAQLALWAAAVFTIKRRGAPEFPPRADRTRRAWS